MRSHLLNKYVPWKCRFVSCYVYVFVFNRNKFTFSSKICNFTTLFNILTYNFPVANFSLQFIYSRVQRFWQFNMHKVVISWNKILRIVNNKNIFYIFCVVACELASVFQKCINPNPTGPISSLLDIQFQFWNMI